MHETGYSCSKKKKSSKKIGRIRAHAREELFHPLVVVLSLLAICERRLLGIFVGVAKREGIARMKRNRIDTSEVSICDLRRLSS